MEFQTHGHTDTPEKQTVTSVAKELIGERRTGKGRKGKEKKG